MDTKRSEIAVTVNGTRYGWPSQPVVVVCIDGGDPAYLRQALACGVVPNIDRFIETGFGAVADASMPSFTCPNNMSIITGTPTSAHGISGNYYLDTATGEAVVMTGPELLRGETILAGFARAGARVASITAKDKLRRQLGKGLDLSRGSVCFSSERAAQCTVEENGIADVRDLVGMPHRLRSHGVLSETKVPFILSHAPNRDYRRKAATDVLKSSRIFDYASNGTRS